MTTALGTMIRLRLEEGVPYSKICSELGCVKSTVAYHAKQDGVVCKPFIRHNWKEVQSFYDQNKGVRETIDHFKMSNLTWYKAIKRGVLIIRPKIEIPLEEFILTSKNRQTIKKQLIKAGIFEEICCLCKIGTIWNNKSLTLHLDHINGINDDNRIENLRLLCPNCHSQTDTFGSKNIANNKARRNLIQE